MTNKIIGASMFSSAGIAEYYFENAGIDIRTANELIPKRAQLYKFFYPETNVICGSINDELVFKKFIEDIEKNNPRFLLATPPCQGMSSLGKKDYEEDERNYLIFKVFEVMDKHDFDYILIENVPKFLKLYFPFEGEVLTLYEIVIRKYSSMYDIESFVLNAADYEVPQSRPRGFIKIYKRGLKWPNPIPSPQIPLKESIGHLPTLESGQESGIRWHFAKTHNSREIEAIKHTPEGKSALKNPIYFPKKANGEPIKGFHNTYKRMKWDEPCPARAMNNGNMGGHNNVHPGRPKNDGTFTDARVLTLLELFIVSSLPNDLELPDWCTDNLIRTVIGEAIPPMFSKNIVKGIFEANNDRTKPIEG